MIQQSLIFSRIENSCGTLRWALQFLLLSAFLFLAGLFTFIIPPFQAPDEFDHWTTANIRADRFLGVSESCHASANLALKLGIWHLPFRPENKVRTGKFNSLPTGEESCPHKAREVNYGNSLTYFQVIAARVFVTGEEGDARKALVVYYLSRILSALAIGLSLLRMVLIEESRRRVTPGAIGSLIMLAAFISPMTLQQSVSISSDVIILVATIWIFIASFSLHKMNKFDFGILFLSGAVAAATKPTILPLLALPVVINLVLLVSKSISGKNQSNEKSEWRRLLGCHRETRPLKNRILWLVLASLFYFGAGISSTIQTLGQASQDTRMPDINPKEQVAFILDNPIEIINIFRSSVSRLLTAKSHYYQELGWLDTPLSGATIKMHKRTMDLSQALELVLLVFVAYYAVAAIWSLESRRKFLRPLTFLGIGFFTIWFFNEISEMGSAMALYIGWTQPGAEAVRGLQGRYFFPNVVLLQTLVFGMGYSMLANLSKGEQAVHVNKGNLISPIWLKIQGGILASGLILVGCWVVLYSANLILDLASRYW